MTFNFNAPVGQVIAGDQTVTGDNIGTQNNYYGTDDPNTQELAKELVEILQGIVPQISDPTSEAGKEIITAAAMEEIENKPTLKEPESLKREILHYAKYLIVNHAQEITQNTPPAKKRRVGILKGTFVLPLPDDFDEPLEDFKEYME